MYKKMIRILSLILIFIFSTTPVLAYNLDAKENSIENIEYQTSDDANFPVNTTVYAQVGSIYKVTIPKVIVLSGTTKKASYYVNVDGDIAGNEIIYVIPEDIVNLYSPNKAMKIGYINQDRDFWTCNTLGQTANGLVETPDIDAGKWSGTFYFNIKLNKILGDLEEPVFYIRYHSDNIVKKQPFVVEDNNVTLLDNMFEKDGYHFVGWATTPNADVAEFGSGNFNNVYKDAKDEDNNYL